MSLIDKKISDARTRLVLDHPPFYASLLFQLKIEYKKIGTAATDGRSVFIDEDFFTQIEDKEVDGVLAHETMHVAHNHMCRQEGRDHNLWNQACDYAINGILLSHGFHLPKGRLYNPRYNGRSAEEIYDYLMNEQQQKQEQEQKEDKQGQEDKDKDGKGQGDKNEKKDGKGQGNQDGKENETVSDPGGCGAVIAPKTEKEKIELDKEIKQKIAEALSVKPGNMGADVEREIRNIIEPALAWDIILRDMLEMTGRNDYDWTRPSDRHIGRGLVLPSLHNLEMPPVVVAIDTSGSMNSNDLERAARQASAVLEAFDTEVHVIYCNTQITGTQTFTRNDMPLKFEAHGGGGTKFSPVFEYIENEALSPTCVVYFTDLECNDYPEEPDYPVLWVNTRKSRYASLYVSKPPFGQVIDM